MVNARLAFFVYEENAYQGTCEEVPEGKNFPRGTSAPIDGRAPSEEGENSKNIGKKG